ncbi:MAG: cupin domain-containing protein [Planctomycetes bacterium]|nr:cupin domain-containing protein [Planctomycetota bacterium]
MDLRTIAWRSTRYPGIAVHFYASSRSTRRVLALIRMEPGCGYPQHRHTGPEEVLVLQGGYGDERGRYLAGTFVRYEARSAHAPCALPGTEPCVLLALAHEGIELLGGGPPSG